jgi:hypothetical protein
MSYDYLFLRRPKINYVSPPICEVLFSATGSPVIVLEPFTKGKITGLVLGGSGAFSLTWNNFPGALCWTIYKAVDELDPFGDYTIIAECIPGNECEPQPCFEMPEPGCYRVSAITPEGETELSDPFCTESVPPYVQTDPATDIL